MNKKVVLIGATGLIGSHLLNILKQDDGIEHINVVVRRPLDDSNPKVSVQVIDFDNANQFRDAMKDADMVYCAVGTTREKVGGDMEAYRKVDYDIPVNAAKYCKELGCTQFAVVSSLGADSGKSNFYLKLKGEMEDAVTRVGVRSLHIFRPSLLLGKRSDKRLLEDIGQSLLPLLSFFLPKNAKPIKGEDVAQAMIRATKSTSEGVSVYHNKEMNDINSLILNY